MPPEGFFGCSSQPILSHMDALRLPARSAGAAAFPFRRSPGRRVDCTVGVRPAQVRWHKGAQAWQKARIWIGDVLRLR